jgi:hypothetical protein
MEELASTQPIQRDVAGTARNDGGNNASVTSSARARVSKVLKRLKRPKWRKRHHSSSSKSAAEALEAVSESDSVCSGIDSSFSSTLSESFDNPICNNTDRAKFLSDRDVETNHRQPSRQRKAMIVVESASSTPMSSSMAPMSSRSPSLLESLDIWGKTCHRIQTVLCVDAL